MNKLKIDKYLIRRAIVAVVGVCIIAFGIGIIIVSDAGADSLNLFYLGMTKTFGLTVGTWTTIFCIVMIIISFILSRKRIGFSTIAYLCFAQLIIDPTVALLPTPSSLVLKNIICIVGIGVTSIGCGLCLASDMGLCTFDAFTYSIPDFLKTDFVKTRWVIEIILIIIGVLLGGRVGLGTVFCTLLFGPAINFCGNLLKKPVEKFVGEN